MQKQAKLMQLEILSYVLADIETFAELRWMIVDGNDRYVQSMLHTGVPFTPNFWRQNRIDATRAMAYSRAVRKLEERGLVKRITEPQRDRTTHLIPTLDGLRTAIRNQQGKVNLTAVCAGLERTIWGKGLAIELASETECKANN